MPVKPFNDFTWWLNLNQSTTIPDKCFTVLDNVFYNNAQQLQSRYWFRRFGDRIGDDPITSFFFYQRDDNQMRILIAFAGDSMYRYNDNWTWNVVTTGLMQYETIPWRTDERTRWDFAVYKNSVYMCDWVNPYQAYDWTNYGRIDMWTPTTFTFDNTTDTLEAVAHGLNNGDEVLLTTTWTLPAGITPWQVYYVVNKTTDDFQISSLKNWTAIAFTTNGTGTQSFSLLWQPRCRYLQYLWDRLYGAGDDANPITLYYTDAAPTNGNDISKNAVVIGGDEQWIINWLSEYNQLVIVLKSTKDYTVNVADEQVQAIDSQTWGYADRTIQNVWNQLVFFNERGIDTLAKRYGVNWTWSIESKPLSDYIRELIQDIPERQYNASAGQYIKQINNYYFSCDTTNDNIPDTTVVLNSALGARSRYNYPNLYDYGQFIDEDGVVMFLFSSAIDGQLYQMEYGFYDDDENILRELQTKNFDFNDPAQQKIMDFIEITWYKALGEPIPVDVYVDSEIVAQWFITDAMLNQNVASWSLWVDPIGVYPLGVGSSDTDWMQLYLYSFKLGFYARGANIAVNMSWTCPHILEKMKISVNGEPNDVFPYASLW